MTSIGTVKQIPFPDILSATENFDEKNFIASGGFGRVYKGHSEQYGTIAVKRLDFGISWQGQHEFRMEIELLSVYKHENLVSLVGFCDQKEEKILVYKHESNGSLDKLLQSKDLNWIQRLHICLDAAKGLKYLHNDVGHQRRVVHRDVKSSNILLDENMKAKISDFGLSKISATNVSSSFFYSNPCGTIGYIDPEYVTYGVLSEKSDVYAFGVVLFEVMCGRLARLVQYKDKRQFLCILAPNHFEKHTLHEIIYSNIRDQMYPNSLKTFSTLAYHCLTKRRTDRPSMSQIVKKLQKALDQQLGASTSGLRPGAALQQGFSISLDNMTQSGLHTFILTPNKSTCRLMPSLASSSHSTPAYSSQPWKYDVFLSFKQTPTRSTFMGHLCSSLLQQGIYTIYKDEDTLSYGEPISPWLLKAVEGSRIAIVILTQSYPYYSWCLDELVHVMKCKDERGLIVMPIFYQVDPSDIREQNMHYGEALALHESRNKNVESWRKALIDASNLPGWSECSRPGSQRHEPALIKDIVDATLQKLLPELLTSSEDTGLIGLETRMQDLKSQLQIGSGGVRMVGILGSSGSGKSTHASAIYDEIFDKFEGCCFVRNVRDESRRHGLKILQEKVLSNVLKLTEPVVLGSIGEGISMMKSRFCGTNVLIVLDDVDHLDHLKMLAGSEDWFGEGSRIIITTRNKNLLIAHNINIIYEVRLLNEEESIDLFYRHALIGGRHRAKERYHRLSVNMVSKFGGNPSAVKRLASILRGKDMGEWMRASSRLEDTEVDEILELFRTGDDGVESYIESWLGLAASTNEGNG
ncbi:hypothetical protein OSB04_018714 [Centaurea solstitialis]|uniref:non-specific serine/threonine protein kinase n=1 Tax=Centaurea solstitialis TaxID=347529 RepID=A0AA38T5D4_9ASTR|nr:hypothetical protein OSB04_018714 [Centaurea solstitialis]